MNLWKSLILVFTMISWPALADFAELSQGRTYYKLRADGGDKNVVLIHSGKFSSWSISSLSTPLVRAGFNVVRFDLYGMGKSDRLADGVYTRDRYLQQLKELVAHLGWDHSDTPLYLIGSGIGASIGAMYASDHPNQVEALVGLNPAYDAHGARSWKERIFIAAMRQSPDSKILRDYLEDRVTAAVEETALIIGGTAAAFLRSRYKRLLQGDYIDSLYRRLSGDSYSSYQGTYERLGRANFPMLVIAGETDNSFPARDRLRLISSYRLPQFLDIKVYPRVGSELTTIRKSEVVRDIVNYVQSR